MHVGPACRVTDAIVVVWSSPLGDSEHIVWVKEDGIEVTSRFLHDEGSDDYTNNSTTILRLQRARGKSLEQEVALWAELMFLSLDMNLWGDVARLGQLGVLSRDPNTKAGTDGLPRYQDILHGIWATRAQLVLGSVLMPFIERTHYR